MNNVLTRQDILELDDITVKLVTFPADFASVAWAGKQVYIRQLTREEQDHYLRMQFGNVKLKQDTKAKQQEISSAEVYGHDAWLVVKGCCDENKNPLFTDADVAHLKKKNGEAIGWLSVQIIEFSGMKEDVTKTSLDKAEEEVKNF